MREGVWNIDLYNTATSVKPKGKLHQIILTINHDQKIGYPLFDIDFSLINPGAIYLILRSFVRPYHDGAV